MTTLKLQTERLAFPDGFKETKHITLFVAECLKTQMVPEKSHRPDLLSASVKLGFLYFTSAG